ncbi:MAG: Glyoxalase/bleomycin resistance protein/dioxygenase [Candidatus Solibacter sp.]|jgi:PhnB protein|nr:Glyoxalase/bleomycin resistance protein/dioxygenase [Candidatus Solibacter sp.]
MTLNTYLVFDGRCKEAFELYQSVLGGNIEAMITHGGSPMETHTPPEWRDKIMHARLSVDGSTLMGSDAPPDRYKTPQAFSVNIGTTDVSEAERIYHGLSEGGTVHMPLGETFWALRFGMFTDKYGIPWMINCEKAGGNQ